MNDMNRDELGRAAATGRRMASDIQVMIRVAEANPQVVATAAIDLLRRAYDLVAAQADELARANRAARGGK